MSRYPRPVSSRSPCGLTQQPGRNNSGGGNRGLEAANKGLTVGAEPHPVPASLPPCPGKAEAPWALPQVVALGDPWGLCCHPSTEPALSPSSLGCRHPLMPHQGPQTPHRRSCCVSRLQLDALLHHQLWLQQYFPCKYSDISWSGYMASSRGDFLSWKWSFGTLGVPAA